MQIGPLTEIAIGIIDRRGKFALNEASKKIQEHRYTNGLISEALNYYANIIFPRVLPIFPALINLSCKAVGGKPEETRPLAVAMLLITASGDIHDDFIDRSTSKFQRKTIYGKYGKEIALLAGDAFLVYGMSLLQNIESLTIDQKEAITNLITKSMFELAEAEATETRLWKKDTVTPQEYFEVIRGKGSVAELHCRLGGILGCADDTSLEFLADYGRTIGILATIKDEFMDILNFSELKNRMRNEMLPYPIVYAFQNEVLRKQISPIIMKYSFSKEDHTFITKTILDSLEIKQLKTEVEGMGVSELTNNQLLKDSKKGKEAALLLQALATEI